jgi:PleD family two-component response regulator
MTLQHAASRAPIVLLVNRQEWTARALESVLQPAGFTIVKAYTGRQAIETAATLRPDLVIVDYRLSDIPGLEAARSMRELPTVDHTTPFIVATTASLSRKERHECFGSGIWDILSFPLDPVELVAKLEAFLSARRRVDEAWGATHIDSGTGLYNWNGLLARAVELVADAQRNRRWTACVALGRREGLRVVSSEEPAGSFPDEPRRVSLSRSRSPRLLKRTAAALLEATRDSDATGILGTHDFLVLAPGTDDEGAAKLATRLVQTVTGRAASDEPRHRRSQFAAGYYSALDGTGGSLRARDLIEGTMEALRVAQVGDPASGTILSFNPA